MYNLTERQKAVLRWIVETVRANRLDEEFTVMWSSDGVSIQEYQGSHNEIPAITEAIIEALDHNRLLRCRPSRQRYVAPCSLTQRSYDAVDSNFADPTPTPAVTIHGSSNFFLNIGSTISSTNQVIGQAPTLDIEQKAALTTLMAQLQQALEAVPVEHAEDAEAVAAEASDLVTIATSERPNRRRIEVSADGLKKAR